MITKTVEQQVSKSVKPDNLEGFSGGIANIFGGFDEGISWGLEESQDGEGEVGESCEDLAESGATQRMAVFIPPTVFDEVQRVLDLPMIAATLLPSSNAKFEQCTESKQAVQEKQE